MEIIIENYTKIIRNTVVLNNINTKFYSGKIWGLKGINGSGKTMLMRAIVGLIYATHGKVIIDGKVIGKDISFPDSVGILIENPSFINNYTAVENLEVIASIKKIASKDDIMAYLEKVGLNPKEKKIYKKFSLGMKQKLGIAAALFENPDIIILDEPFNALDSNSVENMKKILMQKRQEGKLIIIACHSKEDMEELCDEIIEIEDGNIVVRS